MNRLPSMGPLPLDARRGERPVMPRTAGADPSDGEGKIKAGATHGRETRSAAGGTLSATPAPMAVCGVIGAGISRVAGPEQWHHTISERSRR